MEAYEKQKEAEEELHKIDGWKEIYSHDNTTDEEINNIFADYGEETNRTGVHRTHDAEVAGDSEETGHTPIRGDGDSNGVTGNVSGSQELGERPSDPTTPALTDVQQREVDRINALYDESIKDAETRLQNAKIERSKKEAFLESRNGLFGDTKTDESQNDLFAGTFLYSQDTKKAALALFDKRINDIEKEMQDLEAERNADIKDVLSQVEIPISEPVQIAPDEVNTTPTPAQKEAGNYKKAHIKVQGLDIAIENPTGTERTGVDPNGKP